MAFQDEYTVKAGDNLTKIGREFGFDNPGPIYAYPDNQPLFRTRSPNLIRPGERLIIPFHPNLLKKIIATSNYLATQIANDAADLIRQQSADKKKLESFLIKVDAANFLANVGLGIGSLAVRGAKGVEMTGKEALLWLAESRVAIGGGMATLVIPSPEVPKKDFKFFIRHTLGPWNPSFWASVAVAIQEGDVDLYLYGADATAYKAKTQLKQQADADLAKLKTRVSQAQAQMAQPCYKTRI